MNLVVETSLFVAFDNDSSTGKVFVQIVHPSVVDISPISFSVSLWELG